MLGGLIDLNHVAAAERPTDAGNRKQSSEHFSDTAKPFVFEAIAQVVHWTTRHSAVGVVLPVFGPQCAFNEFAAHPQQARNNHPKSGPWPSETHSHRDTSDVSHTHRTAERRCQCLKVTDFTLVIGVVKLATDHVKCMLKPPDIEELEINREEDCSGQQPNQNKWDVHSAQADGKENHLHDRVRDRLHD